MSAPRGRVTLVFTDVQGSTALWEEHPDAMRSALALHDALMRQILEELRGYEVKTEGDAFMVAFAAPAQALRWCLEVQLGLVELDWPAPIALRGGLQVRMGAHEGEPECRENPLTRRMDYFGPVVNRAARIAQAAHGGQLLVSEETWREVRIDQPVAARALGSFALKGLRGEQSLVEVLPARLARDRTFPPLRVEAERPQSMVHETGGLEQALRAASEGLLARAQIRAMRGHLDAALADAEASLGCARAGGLEGLTRQGRLFLAIDRLRTARGEPELEALRALAAEAEAAGDPRTLARATLELGRALCDAARSAEGRACVERALSVSEAQRDPEGMAGALLARAVLHRREGDASAAERSLRKALEILESAGSHRSRGEVLVGLARLAVEANREDAEALLERAMQYARRTNSPADEAWAALQYGTLLLERGDQDGAERWLGEAARAFEVLKHEEGKSRAALRLVQVYAISGRIDEARAQCGVALSGAREMGVPMGMAAALVHEAAVEAGAGDVTRAAGLLQVAERLLSGAERHPLFHELEATRELIALVSGNRPEADRMLEEEARASTLIRHFIRLHRS